MVVVGVWTLGEIWGPSGILAGTTDQCAYIPHGRHYSRGTLDKVFDIHHIVQSAPPFRRNESSHITDWVYVTHVNGPSNNKSVASTREWSLFNSCSSYPIGELLRSSQRKVDERDLKVPNVLRLLSQALDEPDSESPYRDLRVG